MGQGMATQVGGYEGVVHMVGIDVSFMAMDVLWPRWAAAIADGWGPRWMDENGWDRQSRTRDGWRIRVTTEIRWPQAVVMTIRIFIGHLLIADLNAQELGRAYYMQIAGKGECWSPQFIHAEKTSGRIAIPRCLYESTIFAVKTRPPARVKGSLFFFLLKLLS